MTMQFRKIHLFQRDLSTTSSGVSIPMFVITEYSIYFQSLVKHFHHNKYIYICIHIISIYCSCNLSSGPSLVSLLNYLNQLFNHFFANSFNPSSNPLHQATQFWPIAGRDKWSKKSSHLSCQVASHFGPRNMKGFGPVFPFFWFASDHVFFS